MSKGKIIRLHAASTRRCVVPHLTIAVLFLSIAAVFQTACNSKSSTGLTPPGLTSASGTVPVSPAAPEDGNWTIPGKDYASTRFSGLDQINASNVGNLKVAWTFSTGVDRGQE